MVCRSLEKDGLWEYSDKIFRENPVVPNIPSSPVKQKPVGNLLASTVLIPWYRRIFTEYLVRIFGKFIDLAMACGDI